MKYGAGQPSVTYVEGKFYLMFTDTTAISVDPGDVNTTSEFVLRSPDPTFQSAVEELTGPGKFTVYDPALLRPYAFFTQHDMSINVDWQYVDATDQFLIADVAPNGQTRTLLFNSALSRKEGEMFIPVPASWLESPGIVSSPDKHAVPSPSCGVIPVDVMRAYGPSIPLSNLSHGGFDWLTSLPCECTVSPTLNAPGYAEIADFNNDSYADLASHHRTSGVFEIRRNLGNGTFESSPWKTATTPSSLGGWETITADFDGDGFADYADRHIASGQIWVHRNLGFGGGFDASDWAFGYTAAGANIEVLAGDFDQDGRADLLEHNRKTGQLWIRRNDRPIAPSNAFTPLDVAIAFRSQAGSDGANWRLVVADFNGDNYADVADVYVPGFFFWVHTNVGSYQFNAASWNPVATFNWPNFTTVFGDFDHDGWADYADVNRGTGEIWGHHNNQNTSFDQINNAVYGIYPIGGGGKWILGVPVSLP